MKNTNATWCNTIKTKYQFKNVKQYVISDAEFKIRLKRKYLL